MGCSLECEKLIPVIIGKSVKPKCLKGIDLKSLDIIYKFNSTAWMTSKIFVEWLNNINLHFKKQKKKILILINNVGSLNDLNIPVNKCSIIKEIFKSFNSLCSLEALSDLYKLILKVSNMTIKEKCRQKS